MFGKEPVKLVDWSIWITGAALVLGVGSVLGFRLGLFGHLPALLGVAIATLIALASLPVSGYAVYTTMRSALGLDPRAAAALGAALLFVLLPFNGLHQFRSHPVLNDISTDLTDPPVFTAAASLRSGNDNPVAEKPAKPEQQKAFYKELGPIVLDLDTAAAFDRVVAEMAVMGWKISARDADAGTVEAVVTTMALGFKDDVVVRLRPEGAGTRIDMRSASRLGRSDFGANARRIKAFFAALES